MAQNTPEWLKPALWGAVAGAIAITVTLFATGLVMTDSKAQEIVADQSDKAVLAALTPICVAQFKQATSASEQRTLLVALQAEKSWQQEDFVSERGWATMPGSMDPNNDVADACASELIKLGD